MPNLVLVLNASWIPIETISWEDAFTKVFNGRAYVAEYYEEIIRTPSDEYLKPAVIVCHEYNKMPVKKPVYSKKLIWSRDQYLCQYCRKQLHSGNATIDHIVPRSRGGRSTFENTVCACAPCNAKKADKLLKDAGMSLIKQPGIPRFNPIKEKFSRMTIYKEWEDHLSSWVG